MPSELERRLKREARKRGYAGRRAEAFVYGTMRKAGWEPKRKARKGDRGYSS